MTVLRGQEYLPANAAGPRSPPQRGPAARGVYGISVRLQVAYAWVSGMMSAMREAFRLSAVRRRRLVPGPRTGA